ncbi:hypothetical protein ABTX80_37465 [Streptomyces erythrochromogenes]|uniref:hypothetical protein n=1 Tax=Streptomyces erythrochromogenes TaxID=285574 RepID=UPI00332C8C02
MSDQRTSTCPACEDTTWAWAGRQPGYDHIHRVVHLPDDQRDVDTHFVMRGFAVGFSSARAGGLPQTWVFFEHLEPALVFGRAGRMSTHGISRYGVYQAAHETRFDFETAEQVTTLYVSKRSLDRKAGEDRHFAQWVRGVRLDSAYYEPPAPIR